MGLILTILIIFYQLNISYNKYFYYLCPIKRYIEHGKEHDGNQVAPKTGAKNGDYGRAD